VSEPAPPPDEIVIVAPRRADPGTLVDRLGPDDLRMLGAPSVGEALERLPAISAGGDSRGERLLVLRGFEQRRLSVTIDGIPVAVPYDGLLDLNKLPLDLIERVSVVKGASPTLYGPNGPGGAINLTTREPGKGPLLRAATETSPWRETRGSAAVSVRFGAIGALVGGGYENVVYKPMPASFRPTPNEDGGRRDNTDRRGQNVSAKVAVQLSDAHRLTLSLARVQGVYGVPRGVHDFNVRFWRWTGWNAGTLGAAHAYQAGGWTVETLFYGSQAANTLDTYDDGSYTRQTLPRTFHSTYDDDMLGGRVRTTYRGSLAGDRGWTLSSWHGVRHDRHASRGDRDEPLVRVATTTLTTSGSIELEPARSVRATAALELDGEVPGSAPSGPSPRASWAPGPMGSLAWAPIEALTAVVSVARRTRFPTLRERYSTAFGGLEPNPGLAPEQATHLALDVTARPAERLRLAAGLFTATLDNLIQPIVIRPQTEQQQNTGDGRLQGAEVSASWAPDHRLRLQAAGALLRARSRTGQDAPEQAIFYRPEHRLLGVVTLRPWGPLALTLVVRQVGPQAFQNPDSGLPGRLGTYRMFDARAELAAHRSLRVWVRASNLTDVLAESRFSFPENGREVFVGLASNLDSAQTEEAR